MDETVEIKKEMFDDFMDFLKESEREGNSYASLLIKKYDIKFD